MNDGMPEWLVIVCMALMWVQGFTTGGIVWGQGPFWDGFRDFYSFRWLRRIG